MKKTILASAIALTALASVNANADVAVSNMVFGNTYAAGGTLTDAGNGNIFSIDPFYGHAWTAAQQTVFMDSSATWNGTSGQGAFDFDSAIAGMTGDQRAVGMFFDWNSSTGIAVLEIFDCVAGTCSGNGVPMANGPFAGSIAVFNGTGSVSAVPVPAAAWLMGSGLLGLVGVARRRKQA